MNHRFNPLFLCSAWLCTLPAATLATPILPELNPWVDGNHRSPWQQRVDYGDIRGLVLDAGDGQSIPGATVIFASTRTGTSTNSNGEFRFERKEVGEYTLQISFIGYRTTERTVTVTKGQIASLTVRLSESTTTLDDVVVRGLIDKSAATPAASTEVSTVNRMKNEEMVFSGISHEQIVKSLDRSAADVVRRVSSVSLLDRFVVVRGMDPRYNLTLLNGIVAPSSEESTRAFSYDALPTGVIDNIGLYKSPAPELPAMWGGGVLDLSTRRTSVAREITVSVSTQYRDNGSSLTDNFLTYDVPGRTGNDDWFAAGANDRRQPAILRQRYFLFPDAENYPLENAAIARAGDFRTYTPQRRRQNLDFRGNFSYYDSWLVGNKVRINNLTAASYTNEGQFRKIDRNQEAGLYTFYGAGPRPAPGEVDNFDDRIVYNGNRYRFNSPSAARGGIDSVYEQQVRLSAIQGIGVSWSNNHHIDATVFYNRFGTDQVLRRDRDREDLDPETLFTYRYNERSIAMAQLQGEHIMGTHRLAWTVGGALTRDDVPDLQYYSFQGQADLTNSGGVLRPEDRPLALNPGVQDARSIFTNTHYIYETKEQSFTGRLDYVKEFEGLLPGLKLKAGAFFDRKDRTFYANNHSVGTNNSDFSLTRQGSKPYWSITDSLLGPQNFGPNRLILRQSGSLGAYSFDDETRAGYLGVNVPLLNRRLNLYGGARLVRFERKLYDNLNQLINNDSASVAGKRVLVPEPVSVYLLPSVSLRYAFLDSTSILRLTYGQTVDRPQFREQSQLQFLDFELERDRGGNPGLRNAELQHLDLRYEYYPSSGEVITLGGFYKRISNPILINEEPTGGEQGVVGVGVTNGGEATLLGVELELRKRLDFVPWPVVSKLSLIANLTYINSEAFIPEKVYLYPNGDTLTTTPSRTTRLQGASPWLANVGLYYDDTDLGTNVSAIYNYTGDRLQIYSGFFYGDILEARRGELDLTFTQRIARYLSIKGGVQNVLNNTVRFYRDADGNYDYNPGVGAPNGDLTDVGGGALRQLEVITDFTERAWKPGRYYSLGVSVSFQ